MARARTHTLLSIDEWGQILGINPFELNQLGAGLPKVNTKQCNKVFFQENYQQDFLSREAVAQAIADAESAFASQVGFWPAPRYTVGELLEYPRPHDRRGYGTGHQWRGDWKSITLEWARFIGGGVLNRTSLGITTDLVFSDEDGDGFAEAFTCSRPYTTNEETSQIGVYFQETDRLGNTLDETWRIRPVQVEISAGVATITGSVTLLVNPAKTAAYDPDNLDATELSNYVTQVELFRVWTDNTHSDDYPYQGVAEWDNPCECTPDCDFSVTPVCLGERLNSQGMPYVGFTPSCEVWPGYSEPNRVSVNYVSGLALANGKMQPDIARIITYLACAFLPQEPCGCDRSQRIIAYWREPESVKSGNAFQQRTFTAKEIDRNPFGVVGRGAIWAWKRIQNMREIGVALA